MSSQSVHRRGRGTAINPPNRFERLSRHEDAEAMEACELRSVPTTFHRDTSRSALSENNSPDVPFSYSLNPYRGCEHGCPYCYARPTHEYLGFSAGLDFETRIMVKEDAPTLLARQFEHPKWKPQVVALSGVADPYQPVERRKKLTRACLEVFLAYRNPVSLITKNHLVTRDLDILRELARLDLVHVSLSVTSLDDAVIGSMEPRASRPARRLEALRELSEAGIPTGVMVAPVIPGLTDEEMPAILKAARKAGAQRAGYIVVRLPGAVEPVFREWLEREFPYRAGKVLSRIESLREGRLNDPRFGSRMRGSGHWADLFSTMFTMWTNKLGLNLQDAPLATHHFRRSQAELFR